MLDIIAELTWRGLIHQTTADANWVVPAGLNPPDRSKLSEYLSAGSRALYAGFDPTADSLHVGHLMALMILRRFQRAGHKPIALVGGATGMIGDPSGKSEERNLLSVDTLRANVAAIEQQVRQFLEFDAGDNRAVLVNNFDWMSRFSYLDFLRDIGKHFPVNVMLGKDSVKNRLGRDDAGISYTEFSYMLLQAYDFVHLNQQHGCELQVGGSDQWGNITAGIDLARRMRSVQLYGLTCPLFLKADGTKMGKTDMGAVWLSAKRTSPSEFYQYWINVADADAGNCLRFLTELDQDTIQTLDLSRMTEPHKRESQRCLADELTRLVHGENGLASARRGTDKFSSDAVISEMNDSQIVELFSDVQITELQHSLLDGDGFHVVEALDKSKLVKSKSEARRAIEQGGFYINNQRCEDLNARLTKASLASETIIVLRVGKKKYALLRFAT